MRNCPLAGYEEAQYILRSTCRNAHCNSNFEPLHQQMSAGCERYILTAIFCDLVLNLCQMAPLVCETHSRALRHQTNKPRTVKPIKSAWTVDNATGIVSRILNLPATMLCFLDGYESIRSGSTDPSPTHPHERNWVFWLSVGGSNRCYFTLPPATPLRQGLCLRKVD